MFCAMQNFRGDTMMTKVCSGLCFLLSRVLCIASLDLSQIQVYPENGGISDVFIVQMKKQPYRFNATTAVDVCTSLGVSIATHNQVKTAQSNGLQTCRYGWVMEKVAVIPRTEKNLNCGQNKVGVIVWTTPLSRLFDVFCSGPTGQTEATTFITSNMITVYDGRTDAKTIAPSFSPSAQPNKYFLSSSQSPQPISTGLHSSEIPTIFNSATLKPMTTKSSQTSTFSRSLPSAGIQTSIASSFSTSFSSTDLVFNYSSVTISSNETDVQLAYGKRFSFRALPLACVILGVMLLIMAGTGVVWYFKIKHPQRLSPWERMCHKDMFETEMWKHTEQQHFDMLNDSGNCGDTVNLQMEDDISS